MKHLTISSAITEGDGIVLDVEGYTLKALIPDNMSFLKGKDVSSLNGMPLVFEDEGWIATDASTQTLRGWTFTASPVEAAKKEESDKCSTGECNLG